MSESSTQDSDGGTMKRTATTRRRGRTHFQPLFPLLTLFFTLLLTPLASALTITSINTPATVHEGENLTVNFTTDEPASYAILENGVLVANTSTFTRTLDYDSAGLLTYTFIATANTTVNRTATVEVLDIPLAITLQEPAESDYATTTLPVHLTTNIPADICYTVTEEHTYTLTQESPTTYNGTLSLADGLRTVLFKCNRNGEVASEERIYKIDTTPPTITLSPHNVIYNTPTLTAVTNEASDCRYGTTMAAYDALPNPFPQTASTTHQVSLDIGEGTYTYVVACRDVLGNTATPVSTSFTFRQRPTATISVEGSNPHKAGSYPFTLEVSKPLKETPTLKLLYQGDTAQTLALTQEDATTYKGVIIVPDDAGEQVASFSFSGTDENGVTGTEIEDGELFLIDTVKPQKVTAFRAVNGTNGVNLSWYYEGEETMFNLYRTTGRGVDYTDFYTTVTGDHYFDTNTEDAVKYYYRIAAVDDAGNVGPLSDEEWASPAAAKHAAATTLDPVLQVDVNARLDAIEREILDAEQVVRDLRQESDKERARIIKLLSLDKEAGTALRTLKEAKSALEALKHQPLTTQAFTQKVQEIEQRVEKVRLLEKFTIENQASYEEVADQESLEAAVSTLLRGSVVAQGERDAYLAAAQQLQEKVRVMTTATVVQVAYRDGEQQRLALMERRLLADEPLSDVVAVEMLPKRLGAPEFFGEKPLKLDEGVYRYSFSTLSDETIVYAVETGEGLPTLRQARLVILPQQHAAPVENQVTGQSIDLFKTTSQNLLFFFGIIILVGLATYYFSIKEEPVREEAPVLAPVPTTPVGFVTQPVTRTILVQRHHEPLVSLLLHGHELADEGNFLDALYFYKAALERYGQEELSDRVRETVREELVLLHNKLALLELSSKAHDAVYAEDDQQLAQLMEQMRYYAATIGEEGTKLVEKAKAEYTYFYNKLNQLKRENEGELVEQEE